MSDISMNLNSYSNLILTIDSIAYLFIDLPWVVSGSSTVSYALSKWNGTSSPNFVSLNQTAQQLTVNTAGLTDGTKYSFGISISINGTSANYWKIIYLKVNKWSVAYCSKWEASNMNDCNTWNTRYKLDGDSSLNNNTWVEIPLSTTALTTVNSMMSASVILSMCNLSTPQGLWMTMDQFQLILLLLLANANIPQMVVDYLSGMKDTTWSFNFIPFKDIPGMSQLLNKVDFYLDNKDLKYFGLFSGSFLINNFSFIFIILIITIIQPLFLTIHWIWMLKVRIDSRRYRIWNKLYQLFVFSIFIRLFMETSQFMMISSIYQIYSWNLSDFKHLLSFVLSIIWVIIITMIIILSFWNWRKRMERYDENNHYYLKEFLSSIKDHPWARIYSTLLMTRRLLLVYLLILGNGLLSIYLVSAMIWIQVVYLSLMLILRPFKEFKDNLIIVLNDVYYLVLISILAYFNDPERWNDTIATMYMYLIMSNSSLIIFILTGKSNILQIHIFIFIVGIIIKACSFWRKMWGKSKVSAKIKYQVTSVYYSLGKQPEYQRNWRG